ncbi:MAG: sodium:proton antiporter [Paludibacteraceae bacterium]|nr:sodium:proton antiporter [Paludibacteraceae bacterium]
MKKIIIFSICLVTGLIISQILPDLLGGDYGSFRSVNGLLLSVALSFIMINVGREFELDKSQWRTYRTDYFVAMITAAAPWLLVAVYYMWLMPEGMFWDWGAWKSNLLLSRFAAPTSAGILFTMLAAIGLKNSWFYRKIQTLAIFDDLDTILLMIPLQIMMVGLQWELHIILVVVFLLLFIGWKKINAFNLAQKWYHILFYAAVVVFTSEFIYRTSKIISDSGVHIEVLLPAFILGMVIKTNHNESKTDQSAANLISYIFMFLVGISMPVFMGQIHTVSVSDTGVIMPDLTWGEIAIHVVVVSLLSNLGKMVPMFYYRDRSLRERLALSIGMFTRGEVGAGIIFIAIGYNIGGPLLAISVLTIVLNLILTGFFIMIVKKLVLKSVEAGEEQLEGN